MILAFFGAFNPPTSAHLQLARFALEAVQADKVIFVPSRSAYIRDEQGKDFAYSDEHRLAMLREAAKSRPWMEITDWELRLEQQPRTYETLCHLRDTGPSPSLLMGSDKLAELEHSWLHVEKIAREFGIVCLSRGSDRCAGIIRDSVFLSSLAPWIRVLETPEQTRVVSSTIIRQKIREIRRLREELSPLVPEEILPMLLSETPGAGSGREP